MKLLERSDGRLVFQIGVREKALLGRLLSLYPLQPDPPAALARQPWDPEKLADAEALLREALREQRSQLADWIHLRFTDGEAFQRLPSGWRLVLETADIDQLLRVLNELRVGAWTKLGCPEEIDSTQLYNSAALAPFHAIMSLAGQYEMILLHALED